MKKLFLAIFIFLTCSKLNYAQESGCFKINTSVDLELETNISFRGYDAFFFGEFHGVYGVPEIKLALIKYLNRHYGITDVFMETGYSDAYLYNAYLTTGDTSYLVNPYVIYYLKKPYRDFFTKLYEYNSGLEHKITIRAMDFERIEFLKVLKLLMPFAKEKPKQVNRLLSYVDTVTVLKLSRIHSAGMLAEDSIYQSIRDTVQKYRGLFKDYYGANFRLVEQILFNEDTYRQFAKRNKSMYHNMMEQIREYRIRKFMVISGLNHGDKTNWKWKTVCYRLAHTKEFKNRLVDFALLCKNCYDFQLKPEYRYSAFRGPHTYSKDSLLMGQIYNKYFNADCRYTLIPSERVDNIRVSKFSQYLILMKDQPDL